MENKTDILDSHDQLRKLQDKVKVLEFQNEQLRSQHKLSRENHIESDPLDESDILSIHSDDFLDEETWLNTPGGKSKKGSKNNVNLEKWLREHVDNNRDADFVFMKTKLLCEIEQVELGLERNSIDTRTFTRPKRRTPRPSLETMIVPSIYENRTCFSPWRSPLCRNNDDIENYNHSINNTLSSLVSESMLMNANFPVDDSEELSVLYQKIASEPQLNISKNKTFRKTAREADEFHKTFKKMSDPELNATFLKSSERYSNLHKSVDLNATFEITPKSRSGARSALNCTFQIQDGSSSSSSNRSGRAIPCDSGGDDDQHSSASDSSFSSCNRLMNVGDVQNIARLQEESLKQTMSTPKVHNRDGSISRHEEDLPSPILKDHNHEYQSDQSDYSSSADGRPRSSRSSLKSSPGGSPFGSTQILTDVPESIPVVRMLKRDFKSIPPEKHDVPKPQVVARSVEALQPPQNRGMSRLKPPAVKTQGGNKGAPRALPLGRVSNIPRPASRIPPPKIRTAARPNQPANNANRKDGCY